MDKANPEEYYTYKLPPTYYIYQKQQHAELRHRSGEELF